MTHASGRLVPSLRRRSQLTTGDSVRLEELKRRAAECIEASSERLGELSREIWSRPELAYEEHQAHGAMTRFFASRPSPTSSAAAWSVQRNYKLETAFRADWQWDGGPGEAGQALPLRLGFLCEYDALPGIGHACGHNLIAEVGAGAALGLKGALESLRHGPANAAGLPRQAPAVKVRRARAPHTHPTVPPSNLFIHLFIDYMYILLTIF
ncbi:xaa-Arg dipeptidase-like [Elgaria multicarinata webbii]|uniref:xaa-Arg dipeptidase-like n=1 Tax=Elgaria multicarinata webbii TaxID=159646 RepID=UPI002FCD4E1B